MRRHLDLKQLDLGFGGCPSGSGHQMGGGAGKGVDLGRGDGDTELSLQLAMARGEATWRCPEATWIMVSQEDGESQRDVI